MKGNASLGGAALAVVLVVVGCADLKNLGDAFNKKEPAAKAAPEVARSPNLNVDRLAKLAVVVQDSSNYDRDSSGRVRAVEDRFVQCMMRGGYTVASRSDVQRIMSEQKMRDSGLLEGEAAQLGKMLQVPAILIVAVTSIEAHNETRQVPSTDWVGQGKNAHFVTTNKSQKFTWTSGSMSARLVSVDTAEVLWQGTMADQRDGVGNDVAAALLASLAADLGAALPSRVQAPAAPAPTTNTNSQ